MRKKTLRIVKAITALLLVAGFILPFGAVETHAEIFYLQTGRRFDSDFYANYYPDLEKLYGSGVF